MGYETTQKETLEIAWKRGYLSNTKHYELLSRITGLNRKQISNWARGQIRKLGSAPLPSINRDPVSNSSSISESKKFLDIAWERGLLPGTENYTLIQDFTNLSRKKISNWSRNRVRKLEKDQLNNSIATHTGQMLMKTPEPIRKRSLNVGRERAVKRRLAVSRQPALSPSVKWLLMNAVSGVANINEDKLGLLSTLIGYPKEELRKFLLANGRIVEEEGGYLAEQLPLTEKTHSVHGQQQNTSLQPVSQPEPDKPLIKREGFDDLKENVLSQTPAAAADPLYSILEQVNTF